MKYLRTFLLLVVWSCSLAEARNWKKINIPGATCGSGESYSVFIDRKGEDKLLVEFMGGGACWSEESCYGDPPLTNLYPPGAPRTSVIAQEAKGNPWNEHTALFIPYCTGDVYSASHVASYKPGTMIHHQGYNNVVLALQHLHRENILNFKQIKDIMVWGSSAGAIGTFVHSETLDAYLDPSAKRTLIADSPGLHYGKDFWHQFTDHLNHDYRNNFGRINLTYTVDDGFIAPFFGLVYLKLAVWEIGILQSTEDFIMSEVFGTISTKEHRKLVLGPQGIAAISRPYINVKTWIMDGQNHTFLVKPNSAYMRSLEGETAWDFAVRVYNRN